MLLGLGDKSIYEMPHADLTVLFCTYGIHAESIIRCRYTNHFSNLVIWFSFREYALEYLYNERKNADRLSTHPREVLLDRDLPRLNYRHVPQKADNDSALRMTTVVILTTSFDPINIVQYYEVDASTYNQKPVTFEGQIHTVRIMKDYRLDALLLPGAGS